ncbi:siderophore-interacting protein, partial [Escherichia coli]|uniref:siderophore-interacting protein n=1 Tax=Escherichia coli TaxID=562 RepID=UPI0015925047
AGVGQIVLGGEELEGCTSRGIDDHSNLSLPQPDAQFVAPTVTEDGIVWPEGPRRTWRDETPLYDGVRHGLAIDFFIREDGVASCWAMQAQPGGNLTVAGPSGSLVVPEDYADQLYVCDGSGMPA